MYDTPLNHTFLIRHNLSDSFRHDQCLARHQTVPKLGARIEMAFVLLLVSWSLMLPAGLARAQGFNGDNQGCAADAPCFNGGYQAGNTVIFQFTGTCCWDFFNVRYAQVGGGDKQVENKSGTYTFRDVKPNSVYTISVQGCTSHTLSHSTCSSWTQSSVTTAPETGSVSSRVVTPAPPSPRAPAEPPKVLGRINGGPLARPQPNAHLPICDSARSARARNSRAAPDLEAQCRAQGGDPSPLAEPPKVLGRVNGGPQTPSESSQELAEKGSEIVSANMLLAAMRELEPEGPQRVGFEKGVAIAGDQSLWGPGKQSMIDSVPEAERNSAERSSHFIVARNANAKFASDGVSIAEGETRGEVIAARSAEPAGYYTLGFDIGAGIFASAARGGAGHTLPGPGSASIRNSLPPPGVRGFDAAMTLYMGK